MTCNLLWDEAKSKLHAKNNFLLTNVTWWGTLEITFPRREKATGQSLAEPKVRSSYILGATSRGEPICEGKTASAGSIFLLFSTRRRRKQDEDAAMILE